MLGERRMRLCLQEGSIMIFKKVDVWLTPVQHCNGGRGDGATEAKSDMFEPPICVISIH